MAMDAKNAMTTTSGEKVKTPTKVERIASSNGPSKRDGMSLEWNGMTVAVSVTERYKNNIKMPTTIVPPDKLTELNSQSHR